MAVKKEKSFEALLKSFVIASLRRSSYRWTERNKALTRARIQRGLYKCESCGVETKKSNIQLDHIYPIVPTSGFDSWDGYINRLFCKAEGYQAICKACHSVKSMTENTERKMNRDKKKLDKD